MDNSTQQNKKAFIDRLNFTKVEHQGILWEFEEDLLIARQKGFSYKQLAEIVSDITSKKISARAVNYYIARRLKNKKNLYKNKQTNSEMLPPELSAQERLEFLKQKTQKRG